MFNWLYDNGTLLTMLLGTAALGLVAAWWVTRLGKYLIGAAVAGALIVLVWFLISFSDYRRIERSVEAMSAGVVAQDLNRVFAQVSDQFQQGRPTFGSNLDKAAFRQLAEQAIRHNQVTEVRVWGFEPEGIANDGRTATMAFRVKPRGNWGGDAAYYLCRARFVRDPDNQWRLQGFQIFNPFVQAHEAIQIPP